jgi:SOS-response transcriptional repressor LexA
VREPSKRQADVLRAITALGSELGYTPSYHEIMARVGLRSSQGLADHLKRLRAKGLVTWDKNRPRTLRVVSR